MEADRDKRMLEREVLRNMIQQWNANRLDLFELSEPNENLEFHGVMRFYFQDSGQKIATKCIRVASDATVSDVIETLIEKFRPDMRMLSLGSYSLWETHGPDYERRLEPHEKPLLVQLNWHTDDREGRFLLKCLTNNEVPLSSVNEKSDQNFKRKLSKREKKELKKKEKLSRLKSDTNDENRPIAEKLYTELPETSFTRSISNPEAVMRRRRQQKLERKLQQFRSKDGGPDTGGTLKIYGSSLCPDVPYKTLLLSVGDTAAAVVREMLEKYGLSRHEPHHYCIVQVDTADNSEYILEDDECPLAIVMTHPHRSSIMFHVRRRPADSQPRRRKKKAGGAARPGTEPLLVEVAPDGAALENGRRMRLADVLEVGSGNGTGLQLYGPSIQPRHCVVAPADGGYSVTPLHPDAQVYLNGRRVTHTQRLQHGCLVKFGRVSTFRFVDPAQENLMNRNLAQSQNYGSGSIYDRSPTSAENSGAMSPTSLASHHADLDTNSNANVTNDTEYPGTASPVSHDAFAYRDGNDTMSPYNNNTLKLDNESLMMSQHLSDSKDDYMREEHSGAAYTDQDQSAGVSRTGSHYKDNYETTFDLDGNVETKSICSAKSGGSGHDNRVSTCARPGQEAILPAVLEFPEAGQAQFLAAVITRLDPHAPAFKLAPVYTLYLCARYRASTHYRPELTPTERAHKLTAFLHHVATLIHATVQERCTDSAAQAFWMANASELLHFLKCDRHISSFSTQAQELLPQTVQNAFSNLVTCFQEELGRALVTLNSPAGEGEGPRRRHGAAASLPRQRRAHHTALLAPLPLHQRVLLQQVGVGAGHGERPLGRRAVGPPGAAGRLGGAPGPRARRRLPPRAHAPSRSTDPRRVSHCGGGARSAVGVRQVELGAGACVAGAHSPARHRGRRCSARPRTRRRTIQGRWQRDPCRGEPMAGRGAADPRRRVQCGGGARGAARAGGVRGAPAARRALPARAPAARARRLVRVPRHARGARAAATRHAPAHRAPQQELLRHGTQYCRCQGRGSEQARHLHKVGGCGRRGGGRRQAGGRRPAALRRRTLARRHHTGKGSRISRPHRTYGDTGSGQAGRCAARPRHASTSARVQPTSRVRGGYGRRPMYDRFHLRDESTESSTDDSEEFHPHYHGSIPRLIITLDRENNQLQDDLSPETPGCPIELKSGPASARPIPIFTFTCEDFDELQRHNETQAPSPHRPREEAPPVPAPPANYDQSSESGDAICLPPQMPPIDPKLTLDLLNARAREAESYRRRCTAGDDCVSACECCRTPQPDTQQIPYIDEPNSEPVIFENDCADERVATPKIRRILPSLSIDQCDEKKPVTADAECQTSSSPEHEATQTESISLVEKKIDLSLNLEKESKNIESIHSRLKSTLFTMSKSISSKSEDTEGPSTFSTSESFDETMNEKFERIDKVIPNIVKNDAKQILDSIDRKSWKSPDEYRPAFGKVKALTKRFNEINLKYCAKNYKRNCQSSPNLCVRDDTSAKLKDCLPISTSLADIQFDRTKTDTSYTKDTKMSDDEVKSILIQLEDWSRYGSRGSEDTLAQGNEFELPNLPSEEQTENASQSGSIIFNEFVEKKPRTITLDNIKLKSNQSSITSVRTKSSKESIMESSSCEKITIPKPSQVIAVTHKHLSLMDVSTASGLDVSRYSYQTAAQSCPDIKSCSTKTATVRSAANKLCDQPENPRGALRRASERDLPSRLAAEPVKPSKSTPALHHAPPSAHPAHPTHPAHVAPQTQPQPAPSHTGTLSPVGSSQSSGSAWAGKSRSSHNLTAAAQGDAFYQNLTSVNSHPHGHQDRWWNYRTTGNRPQSAHFSAAGSEQQSEPSTHQQINNASSASVRAAKLAEMSEEVTRRQQQQQQLLSQQKQHTLPHQHQHAQLNQHQSPLAHQMSPQQMQHQHQNQMAHQANHIQNQMAQTGYQSSQLDLQLNQLHQNQAGHHMSPMNQQGAMGQHLGQFSQSQMHIHQSAAHYPQQGSPQLPAAHPAHPAHPAHSQNMHQQYAHSQLQSPPNIYHNQHQQPQRYDWHPPGPPSPQRSQPPVAPKPQGARRSEMEDEQMQQLQQSQATTTVQPEDERYVASALEPPAVSVYPAGGSAGAGGGARQQPAHNPWQREERERQAEARRAQARARRDATIAQLLALGASRTPVQNQQLRALQLERDFERRATQHDQEEGGGAELCADEECDSRSASRSPSPEQQMHLQQQNVQQMQQHAPQMHQMAQHSHHMQQHQSTHAQQIQQQHLAQHSQQLHQQHSQHVQQQHSMQHSQQMQQQQSAQQQQTTLPQQPQLQQPPKSILKSNPRSDISNGYAADTTLEESRMSELTENVSGLSVSGGAPAPPERGSSFAVMAGRRALSPATYDAHAHAAQPAHVHASQHTPASAPTVAPQSPLSTSRDKRVSFHERASASASAPSPAPATPASPAPAPPAPPTSSPPPLDPPPREDPDRFISEAERLVSGAGTSPGAPLAHTPGVIGAQEVYRDPRARRLAEQQARATPAAVPETLSFKEKMKMFALEAGDRSTPKDKVKISRAQRDIDAVH